VDEINTMDEETRIITLKGLKEGYLNERYIQFQDNKLIIDKNIMNLDILHFKIRNKVFQNRLALKTELVSNGINVVSTSWDYPTDRLAADTEAKISFEKLCIEYDALAKSCNFGNNTERLQLIAKERPLIPEAYYTIGIDKMAELKFNQSNIKRHITKQLDISQREKIKRMIHEQIGIHKPIELSKAKEIIAEIYSFLGLKKIAKAIDLKEFFHCKEYVKKCNGKSVKCIEIITEKMIG